MIITVKNDTDTLKTWCGQEIQPGATYDIQESEEIKWIYDDTFLTAIANKEALIANGSVYHTSVSDALSYIRSDHGTVQLEGVGINPTDKALLTSVTKPEGASSTLLSHNFCDKTTWYDDSVPITSETLTTSDDLTYASLHTYWINLVSGKVMYEDRISSTYKAKIYVDDVLTSTGFTIDYAAGTVTFTTAQTGKTIKATYSYATESGWYIRPSSGKVLKLLGTQLKMTEDCAYNASSGHLYFQPFMLVNGTPTPAGSATIYKNMCDIIKCASDIHHVPKFAGIPQGYMIMDYDYTTSKELKYSQNTYIKIWLSGHQPMTGTMGACIGFILSINEE